MDENPGNKKECKDESLALYYMDKLGIERRVNAYYENNAGKPGVSYVVSEWMDISSFAYRELLLRDIDPEEGELKMLIQVAAKTNIFRAAINKEVI